MDTAERICDGCTACCMPLDIEESGFSKPRGQWCQHCNIGRGCNIYTSRPLMCNEFRCQWLMGFGTNEQRPDKIGFVPDFHKESLFTNGLAQFWEVEEGAFERPACRVLANIALEGNIRVMYLYISGHKKLALPPWPDLVEVREEIRQKLAEQNVELAEE